MKFFVVQPYGRDKGRETTVVYEADSVESAFVDIDRLAEQMKRTGASPESVELLVVDEEQRVVQRRAN